MEAIKEAIKQIFLSYAGKEWEHIEKIPQSGGDRIYFRIKEGANSYIATFNLNLKENETFIYFAQHFHSKGLPLLSNTVPVIFCVWAIAAIEKKQSNSIGVTSLNDMFSLFIWG